MDVEAYSKLALDNFGFQYPGAFYGEVRDPGVGAGLIYQNVRFPLFDGKEILRYGRRDRLCLDARVRRRPGKRSAF
jgi:hypothetical protein